MARFWQRWSMMGLFLLFGSTGICLLALALWHGESEQFMTGLALTAGATGLLPATDLVPAADRRRRWMAYAFLANLLALTCVSLFWSEPDAMAWLLFLLWVPAVWLLDGPLTPMLRRYCKLLASVLALFFTMGLIIRLLSLDLMYGAPLLHPWALHALVSVATYFVVLVARLVQARKSLEQADGDTKARSINTVGIAGLILIAFVTGLASFAVLKTQVEKALYQRLRLTMVYRSLTLHNAIQKAYQDVVPLAIDRDLIDHLRRLRADPGQPGLREAALRRVDDLLPFVAGQVQFVDPAGRLLAARGDTDDYRPLWVDYRDKGEVHLVWHDQQPYLAVHVGIGLEDGGPLATVRLQVPSPVIEQLLADNYDLGDTGEMLLCVTQDVAVRCIESRHRGSLFVADTASPYGQMILDSLEAESSSPRVTQDESGHTVMVAYGPVGPYGMVLRVPPNGLSMLVRMDTAELYAPIRKQLLYIAPLLVVIILVGGITLRYMIAPLLRALRLEEARFRELTVLSSDGYWSMDENLRFVELRGETLASLGILPEQWLGRTLTQTPAVFEYATGREQLEHALAQRATFYEVTVCLPVGDGQRSFIELSGAPQFSQSGTFIGYRGVARDITLRKLAENSSIEAQITLEQRVEERTAELEATVRFLAREIDERTQAEERFRSLTELSSDWYWELDQNFQLTQLVGEVYRKGGFSAADSVGKCLWELPWADDPGNDWDGLRAKLETGHDFHDFTFRARDFGGAVHHVSISGHAIMKDGTVMGYRGIGKDVSEKQRSEEHVRFLAHYDSLTKLPNRVLLGEHVRLALERARRSGGHVALLFVDLDRFKYINDTLGHGAGDKVLLEVAQRLTRCVRDSDLVARLGGDEFVILLDNVHDGAHVRYTARRMLEGIREPIVLAGDNYQVGASIGVAIFPEDGDNLSDLLKNSDAAMYRAKESGRNGIYFYSDSINELALYGERMDGDLELALERNQFVLHFQAQYDVRERRIAGAEVLLRWRHPQHGMLSPAAFIPAAEESGLIVEIGTWVLRQAIRTLHEWDEAGLPPLTLAVNISPSQLSEQLQNLLHEELRQAGVVPHRLQLEIPESQMLKCTGRELSLLQSLRAWGVQVVLDNYGCKAGRELKVDMLKIDRSYVDGVPRALNKVAVIRAAIRSAQQHGIRIMAEGVETQEQYQWLQDEGCHAVQGFFFSHPMPSGRFVEFASQYQPGLGPDGH